MTKTLKKLFERGCARGSGGVAFLLVLLLAAGAPQGAQAAEYGYKKMGNDRILLMNNDSKSGAEVTSQGYSDTAPSGKTYWEHSNEAAPATASAKKGIRHVMYEGVGDNRRKLWELVNCRAGSVASTTATRNYIPWGATALSINNGTTPVGTTVANAGMVILRNTTEACIYSPVYTNGIGTIYFDAVNSGAARAGDIELDLQIATNALDGVDFVTADNSDAGLIWTNVPFTVFQVVGAKAGTGGGTLTHAEDAATSLVLNSDAQDADSKFFHRVRVQLNYEGPIRFRIRRLNKIGTLTTAAALDLVTNLALVDNIIASYPPMRAVLERYGTDYDTSLKGAEVLGCLGDFDTPLLANGQTDVKPRAWVRFIRNSATDAASKVMNVALVHRWRYLDQIISSWTTNYFGQAEATSDPSSSSNLVGTVGIPLNQGVGDLEYYLMADVDAPFYEVQDYAASAGYGDGWTEAITNTITRANYAEETPAYGRDYFVRIREAESPFEYVKLVTSVTTNGTDVEEKTVRMELVGTNTWRYCYHVPTNRVGETLRFHFEGRKLGVDAANPFQFTPSLHIWKCGMKADEVVPYLPYTSVVNEVETNLVAVKLDRMSTHLIIEFNDDLHSYNVSRGTHQNFNTWTDARLGYAGHAKFNEEGASGDADQKKSFPADMESWNVQAYANSYWTEDFNFDTANPGDRRLYQPFDTQITPHNGWEAGHGQWIRGSRGTSANDLNQVSLQMEGRGQGYVALNKDQDENMPAGIGTVTFNARIAQTPRFDDFAVYGDGTALTNYAVSASITMSRLYDDAGKNPKDISPAQPSVSLVGYYRPTKGCYEFRMTRTAGDELTCALYKWGYVSGEGMKATSLKETKINAGNNILDGNLLVPNGNTNDEKNKAWTRAYLFLFTDTSGNVHLYGKIGKTHTNDTLVQGDTDLVDVFGEVTDTSSPHVKGTYGVGSTDCNAGFGRILRHAPKAAGSHTDGAINNAGELTDVANDWSYYPDRWRAATATETGFGTSTLLAVIPNNQKVRLQFTDELNGWQDSGYEQAVTNFNFSAQPYTFAPSVPKDYKVRLIAGGNTYDEVRTDVVVDDIEITSWRASDFPGLSDPGTYAQSGQWVYTSVAVELALDISGGTPTVASDGANGFVFMFPATTDGAATYTIKPKLDDVVVDRVLIVGGGGAGGATCGAGGAGGEVEEFDLGPKGLVLEKGSSSTVVVGVGGKGGAAKGGAGGLSKVTLKDAKDTVLFDKSKAGGAGGDPGSAGQSGEKGTDGTPSAITGKVVHYGGGGGHGGGEHGAAGGLGGGGRGLPAAATNHLESAGADGFGGGGGGGGTAAGMTNGGDGGDGIVILHLRNASKVGTLQPARGTSKYALGLRSPYIADGLSMFSFNYINAHSNAVLWLQVCTNDVIKNGASSMTVPITREAPTTNAQASASWKTIATFAFKDMPAADRSFGTCSSFISLRAPVRGYMRLVVAPEVIAHCEENQGPGSDPDYGRISVTGVYCYNEPALDDRSWWGWNLHTEGWGTTNGMQYAYLFDSPNGLSGSLNFSALLEDNDEKDPDTRGIGLAEPTKAEQYRENNSFVQCPPLLTNGIGKVTFRARTFTPGQPTNSYVTLYGTFEEGAKQNDNDSETWKYITTFPITNSTYQTKSWSTTDSGKFYRAIRLVVGGSRHGRSETAADKDQDWEKPVHRPIQRVWLDEITVSEPIVPRVVFRDVRPFRSHLTETVDPKPVTNVTDLSEQPILGESWGLQATVEPQQMSDEIDMSSIKVHAAFYNGVSPWGYRRWRDSDKAIRATLDPVSNLVFRSTYNNAASIIAPDMTAGETFPRNVWQYHVWVEYRNKSGNWYTNDLDGAQWTPPSWYYGIRNLNDTYGMGVGEWFAGYTILDSISPQRAWLNEINYCDVGGGKDYENQYIEIAVPQGANLKGWRIDLVDSKLKRGTLARFGSGEAQITQKTGTKPGVDSLNHYTFVALQSPDTKAAKADATAAGTWTIDGTWNKVAVDKQDEAYAGQAETLAFYNGRLRYYEPYGVELVRPSGVIEHQIIVQGTNYNTGSLEYLASGSNLLDKVRAVDGRNSHWFYAGADMLPGSLGVFTNHGETAACWTNRMDLTPSALNTMAGGTIRQSIDPAWFLQPNGTNVWIYAEVEGDHVHQTLGTHTNKSVVFIIRRGGSTNILYRTDPWYQIGEVWTNKGEVVAARGRASRQDGHTWTLELKDVQETLTVKAREAPDKILTDLGLTPADPYYNAVMAWLSAFGDKSDANGFVGAEFWSLGDEKVGTLGVKDMYWLNINPTESNWVFKAGMGALDGASAVAPKPDLLEGLTNVCVQVTMMITNTVTGEAFAPDRIQGIEPNTDSRAYDGKTGNWPGATFQICGALQRTDRPDIQRAFYPLRWFVFGPDSFRNFKAEIEINDPHSESSPGHFHGWSHSDFAEVPIFYMWKLNADPVGPETVEMLNSNSTYRVSQ